MKSIKIKFWGVRGSIPTPGPSTIKYGGNTACVEVRFGNGALFILDAGSGIRELGKQLVQQNKPVDAHILVSHFHWDHIQGLPFFRPAYAARNKFTIIGCDEAALNLDQIISFQMNPTYFPIAIEDMRANIRFRSVKEESFDLSGVNIQTIYLNHPGYALGYRLNFNGKSIVYISDNEPFHWLEENKEYDGLGGPFENLEDMFDNFVEDKNESLVDFCRNSDILIHDTQFLPEEYAQKITWGHSPYNYTVDLAMKSEVKQLILFHHDPDHDDNMIDHIQKLSRDIITNSNFPMSCVAAHEGMTVEI